MVSMQNKLNLKVGDRVKLSQNLSAETLKVLSDWGYMTTDRIATISNINLFNKQIQVFTRSMWDSAWVNLTDIECVLDQHLLTLDKVFKFNTQSKKFEFDLNKYKLTSRQMYIVSSLLKDCDLNAAITYINTTLGKRSRVSLYDMSFKARGTDLLAERPDGWFYKKLNEAYDMKSALFKRPGAEKGEYIGIEIECLIPLHVSMDDIQKQLFEQKIKGVNNVGDASIKDDNGDDLDDDNEDAEYYGREFRILTKVNDLSNLEAFLKILNKKGAYVNKSCGLHVHLDCRDVSNAAAQTRADRLVKALPILTAMVPSSRRDNHFCQWGKSVERDRYYMVNTTSFRKHGTIEVRLHSATTDFVKISNWIKILYQVTRKQVRGEFANLNTFAKKLDLSPELKEYMSNRIKLFNTPEKTKELLGEHPMVMSPEATPLFSELSEQVAA